MTTTTIYPTIDNTVLRSAPNVDWSDLATGNGTGTGTDSWLWDWIVRIQSSTSTDKWSLLHRGVFVFDTSSIPSGDVISAVTLKIGGHSKADPATAIAPDVNVYGIGASGTDTQILAGDYQLAGSTPFCDTPITYAGWDIAGVNDFIFNAAGIAAIDKAGYTRLCLRNANYDVANVAPAWIGVVQNHDLNADMDEGSPRPELEIVHAPPAFIPKMIIV
jgi:hypothetical protein